MHAARYRFSITRASVYTRGGGGKVTSTTASVSTASGWRTQNAYFKTDAQIRDEQVQFASLPLEKKKKNKFQHTVRALLCPDKRAEIFTRRLKNAQCNAISVYTCVAQRAILSNHIRTYFYASLFADVALSQRKKKSE